MTQFIDINFYEIKNNFNFIFIFINFCLGCQTIKQKSDEVVEKENERFGMFVGKQVNDLKLELGALQ